MQEPTILIVLVAMALVGIIWTIYKVVREAGESRYRWHNLFVEVFKMQRQESGQGGIERKGEWVFEGTEEPTPEEWKVVPEHITEVAVMVNNKKTGAWVKRPPTPKTTFDQSVWHRVLTGQGPTWEQWQEIPVHITELGIYIGVTRADLRFHRPSSPQSDMSEQQVIKERKVVPREPVMMTMEQIEERRPDEARELREQMKQGSDNDIDHTSTASPTPGTEDRQRTQAAGLYLALNNTIRSTMAEYPHIDLNTVHQDDGYWWQLRVGRGEMELPRESQYILGVDPYRVDGDFNPSKVTVWRSTGGGKISEYIPKTADDWKKVVDLYHGEIIKLREDMKSHQVHLQDMDHDKTYNIDWLNEQIQKCKQMGDQAGKISDGFHTFDELYEMRLALTVALLRRIDRGDEKMYMSIPIGQRENPRNIRVWRSKQHSDGTMFDDYFIVGVFNSPGHTVTFHYPLSEWSLFDFCKTLEKAPEWDGHTDKDVITRLKSL